MRVFWGLVISVLLLADWAQAQTIVQKRISATRRLVPIKKLTVGPDDQYQATLNSQGTLLVYTHKADLVAHLRGQVVATGEVFDLLPLTADSQEAAFSPDGKLVFTYYKSNARGDICYVDRVQASVMIQEKDIRCLERLATGSGTERANPFWRSTTEIGYLERDITQQTTRIITENLINRKKEVIAEGRVWSPAMNPGGRYLAFNEASGSDSSRSLVVRDLQTGQVKKIKLAIPGSSGFPAVSATDEFVYFSHYLNDTNQDNVIDGADNGVIFRLPISRISQVNDHETLFPEQLTSVETSCSYPRLSAIGLLLTCAFEGSLDIYQTPLTGIVPADWSVGVLQSALKTSRSYQDRILLLNTLRFRGHLKAEGMNERLLVNHIFADDTRAAQYYLDLEIQRAPKNDRPQLEILRLYLLAREKKKAQPSSEINREFEKEILALEKKIQSITGEERLKKIVRGWLRVFVNESKEAQSLIAAVQFSGSRPKLTERVLYADLMRLLYSPEKDFVALKAFYSDFLQAKDLSSEARLFYAFHYLADLDRAMGGSRPERLKEIEKISKSSSAEVVTLFKTEMLVLRLLEAENDAAKLAFYKELDPIFQATREEYYLRKAFYIRALLNFAAAGELRFMDLVASNWLRYTAAEDTEFIFAREVFSDIAYTRAYDALEKKNLDLTRDYFFSALSFTDDLEAHQGYLRALVAQGRRSTIDSTYRNLRERQFIDDNMKFVEALLLWIDVQAQESPGSKATGQIDKAISRLQEMTQDRDSAIRYLLLGGLQMEKVFRTTKGLEFNTELFQQAHQSLMLAYDLGRDNLRIKASALSNLGLLHVHAQNPGVAVKFLGLRKKLGFQSQDDRQRFVYLFAKALYRSRQPDLAAAEIQELSGDLPAPLMERHAFYTLAAGRHELAAGLYEKLFAKHPISGDLNRSKLDLAYGLSLLRSQGKEAQARDILRRSLISISRLQVLKAGDDRALEFEPVRLEILATGLLAQVASGDLKAEALEKRAALIGRNRGDGWQVTLIQTQMQLADTVFEKDPGRASNVMKAALKLTMEYGEANGFLGHTVHRSTVNLLAFALKHSRHFSANELKLMSRLAAQASQAMGAQKVRTPMLEAQELRVRILQQAFQRKVIGESPSIVDWKAKENLIREALPMQWTELEMLAMALEA